MLLITHVARAFLLYKLPVIADRKDLYCVKYTKRKGKADEVLREQSQ